MKFSERYGYVKPSDVLKRSVLEKEGILGLCTCIDYLEDWLGELDRSHGRGSSATFTAIEESIWCFFLNRRKSDFWEYSGHKTAAADCLLSGEYEWYDKIDLIEYMIHQLRLRCKSYRDYQRIINNFILLINDTFKRLNYAYRVVDNLVVEISDDQEVSVIEEALNQTSSVKTHLSEALKHLSNRPSPDYRNSIKESISAVEAICRELTGATTLSEALNKLENNGVVIPKMLKVSFEKLYAYTNDKTTGIRHALIDNTETPDYDEAKFMLVVCSAFVNYIQYKRSV